VPRLVDPPTTSDPAHFRSASLHVPLTQSVTKTAADLGITDTCLYHWVREDRIDRGEIASVSTAESRELRKAHRRIREFIEILRRANAMLGSETPISWALRECPSRRAVRGRCCTTSGRELTRTRVR
jgi:transposase-like protein